MDGLPGELKIILILIGGFFLVLVFDYFNKKETSWLYKIQMKIFGTPEKSEKNAPHESTKKVDSTSDSTSKSYSENTETK